MSKEHVLRRRLLLAASGLLSANGCDHPQFCRVKIRGGRRGDTQLVYREEDGLVEQGSPPETDGMLKLLLAVAFSEDERRIILSLADRPLAAPAISKHVHESGETPSTRLKTLLANLCDRGVLELTREGYRVADARLAVVAQGDDTGTTGGRHKDDKESGEVEK